MKFDVDVDVADRQDFHVDGVIHHPEVSSKKEKVLGWSVSKEMLQHLLHYVPSQGPIKDFIHHNTLHAFQGEKFEQGVLRASRLLGSSSRLTPDEIEKMSRQGLISDEGKAYVGISKLPTTKLETPKGWVRDGIRVPGFLGYGVDILEETRGPLFRILSNYLDQGVAAHSHLPFDDFWAWLNHFFRGSSFNFRWMKHSYVQDALKKDPHAVIEESLSFLLEDPANVPRYLLEILLGHAGWSGLVHQVEIRPEGLFEPKKISTEQVLALELAMDVAIASEIQGFKKFSVQGKLNDPHEIDVREEGLERELRLAQEALEWSFYLKKIRKIEAIAQRPSQEREKKVQVLFCIDDRECSIRRHLESLDESISTYGVAGFFGLDCSILEAGHRNPVQSCPVVLKPRVLIEEEWLENSEEWLKRNLPKDHQHHLSRTYTHPLKGWVHSLWKGIELSKHLVAQVFSPRLETSEKPTVLKIYDRGERDGLRLGYTREEMADRVFSVLRNIEFHQEFSKLVIIVSHESKSNNNPHYAAYDCGACSGRSGAQNARAFAMMANDPEVRKLLVARGLRFPEGCYFIGAAHNTTQDQVRYFDLQELPDEMKPFFRKFSETFEKSLSLNAKERTRKFELFPEDGTPEQARDHVILRSVALFEPRPELNHATNAMCVVGHRNLTQGDTFDRRSFLHSYDFCTDQDGVVLSNILNAVVPVCGGINLEYYFSRMDNAVYGAGTKLPHNVVGLFGVSCGVIGDLKTGLPSQMIEVHDPLRLLIIVEQTPEVALRAVQRNPQTFEWVENEWVHYACFNPIDKKIYRWFRGEWKKVIL